MNTKTLQSALNTLGADPPLVVDGIYGDATTYAVSAFQTAHGLTADGVVGPATGAALAHLLQPQPSVPTVVPAAPKPAATTVVPGVPVAVAAVLDCTDWYQPAGGWVMPANVAAYRFFFQPAYPGGGRGADAAHDEQLDCSHVQVPAQAAVIEWVTHAAIAAMAQAPGAKVFALLIRGLTFGNDSLSPLEYEQAPLVKLGVECQIVSEGLLAHDNLAANLQIIVDKAKAGYKIIVVGHSMGGDEVCKIVEALAAMALTA